MMMKRNKMLTMWVTEDEHARLRERCNGKQLAAWMRQTCLGEKPARAGKLPSISPALLRQLAGMGNNLNQIARKVNAGGCNGHDRVQVVAALMAIDAGLERLRHAVIEKGRDDDS
ncbi:mobilization protein [Salmonella enterica subsp. enterica serovar Sarajane]|nr:mobilization protein [Salmonella enterica subsp. enterica serovar Sarajane]